VRILRYNFKYIKLMGTGFYSTGNGENIPFVLNPSELPIGRSGRAAQVRAVVDSLEKLCNDMF
jgi:hypothetical protein